MLNLKKTEKVMGKIENYINDMEYGKVILSIHQGDVAYIEIQEKEKII